MRDSAQLVEAVPLLYENVYGVSPIVGINVVSVVPIPSAITLTVKDIITKKPIAGATVIANTNQTTTDETGTAVFTTIPLGTYTITIKHPSYLTKTLSVTVTEAGKVVEVSLIPLWGISVGIVGGMAVITLAVTKALKWW